MDRRDQADVVGRATISISTAQFIKLKGVRAKPKPYGGTRPVIMNAGASPAGRAFAVRNCDAFFMQASRVSVEETAQRVAAREGGGRGAGPRDRRVHGRRHHLPADHEGGARSITTTCVVEQADWAAVDSMLAMRNITPQTTPAEEFMRQRRHYAHGNSGLPIVGDPDHVARQLDRAQPARASPASRVSLVNYRRRAAVSSAPRCCRGWSARGCVLPA